MSHFSYLFDLPKLLFRELDYKPQISTYYTDGFGHDIEDLIKHAIPYPVFKNMMLRTSSIVNDDGSKRLLLIFANGVFCSTSEAAQKKGCKFDEKYDNEAVSETCASMLHFKYEGYTDGALLILQDDYRNSLINPFSSYTPEFKIEDVKYSDEEKYVRDNFEHTMRELKYLSNLAMASSSKYSYDPINGNVGEGGSYNGVVTLWLQFGDTLTYANMGLIELTFLSAYREWLCEKFLDTTPLKDKEEFDHSVFKPLVAQYLDYACNNKASLGSKHIREYSGFHNLIDSIISILDGISRMQVGDRYFSRAMDLHGIIDKYNVIKMEEEE